MHGAGALFMLNKANIEYIWYIQYTLVTQSVPVADVGSDHDMVMMTLQTRLKKSKNQTSQE